MFKCKPTLCEIETPTQAQGMLAYIQIQLSARCSYARRMPDVVRCSYWAGKLIFGMNVTGDVMSSCLVSLN